MSLKVPFIIVYDFETMIVEIDEQSKLGEKTKKSQLL